MGRLPFCLCFCPLPMMLIKRSSSPSYFAYEWLTPHPVPIGVLLSGLPFSPTAFVRCLHNTGPIWPQPIVSPHKQDSHIPPLLPIFLLGTPYYLGRFLSSWSIGTKWSDGSFLSVRNWKTPSQLRLPVFEFPFLSASSSAPRPPPLPPILSCNTSNFFSPFFVVLESLASIAPLEVCFRLRARPERSRLWPNARREDASSLPRETGYSLSRIRPNSTPAHLPCRLTCRPASSSATAVGHLPIILP